MGVDTASVCHETDASPASGCPRPSTMPDAAAPSKGMGEGQKPVSQAYKDNWNAIYAKKKKKQ